MAPGREQKDGCHEQWRESQRRAQFRTATLVTSAAMVGGGSIIALAGLALGGGHMMAATRRWVNSMDVPVSQLAKSKYTQARAAMSAGAQAWQKNGSATAPVPSGY